MESFQKEKMTPKTFFLCRWKRYHSLQEIKSYIPFLLENSAVNQNTYLIAVPLPYLKELSTQFVHPSLVWGSHEMPHVETGSFTESVATHIIQENKGRFVLIGTAESRQFGQETDEIIHNKIVKALQADLTPILCIGESFEDQQAGNSLNVMGSQCKAALKDLRADDIVKIVFVYEAPWLEKAESRPTHEKMIFSYFQFRQALLQVIGEDAFYKTLHLDAFPDDIPNQNEMLQALKGHGFYFNLPETCASVVKRKSTMELKEESGEVSVNQLPAELFKERDLASLSFKKASKSIEPQPVAESLQEKLPDEPVNTEDEEAGAPIGTSIPVESLPQEVDTLEEIKVLEELVDSPQTLLEEPEIPNLLEEEKEPKLLSPPADVNELLIEETMPETQEIEQETSSITEEPKVNHSNQIEEPIMPISPESENMPENPAPEPFKRPSPLEPAFNVPRQSMHHPREQVEEFAEDLNALESKKESLLKRNDTLAQNYKKVQELADKLPKLREKFPELLNKMTADLNKLPKELQDHINRGNVAFFSENPDKAKEAGHVLQQLQHLSGLFQETAAIPREVDRLLSSSREVRRELEKEWAYFRVHNRKIKEKFPEFALPTHPSQLLIKEPTVELAPKDAAQAASLTTKKIAIVKTPPKK